MQSFKTKTEFVDAIQFNVGTDTHNGADIRAALVGAANVRAVSNTFSDRLPELHIANYSTPLHATVVRSGDWVVRHPEGTISVVSNAEFAANFEPEDADRLTRLSNELEALTTNRFKLGRFIESAEFQVLPWQERELLKSQMNLMTLLSAVLSQRVASAQHTA